MEINWKFCESIKCVQLKPMGDSRCRLAEREADKLFDTRPVSNPETPEDYEVVGRIYGRMQRMHKVIPQGCPYAAEMVVSQEPKP